MSTIVVCLDYNLNAENQDPETNNISNSRSYGLSRGEDFNWGEIEVISEPVLGQNYNINASISGRIAIEDDNIYVVWSDRTDYNGSSGGGIDYDIFYRFFNGIQWSEIQVISEPIEGQNYNTNLSWSPDIAVENGKIYVVWEDNRTTWGGINDSEIFYRCNLTGTGWEDIQIISEPVPGKNLYTGESIGPTIVVKNGKIYVIWTDSSNINGAGTDYDVFLRTDLTGNKWEDIQVISEPVEGKDFNTEPSFGYSIAVENDKIYVVWGDSNNTNNATSINHDEDIFYRYFNGFSWERIQVISEPILGRDYNSGRSWITDIVVEHGKIYVVWEDENNTYNSGTDSDIFYRCNLTGYNWEDIQVISEPVQGLNLNNKYSENPSITVENSRIYIVWHDSNNTDNSGADSDIFYRCNFKVSSWESIQVISEPVQGSNFNGGSSYSPDIVVSLGKSYIAWEDESNIGESSSDRDIFYRWIKDPSPLFLNSPSVTPKSGNTSTEFIFTVTYFNYENTAPIEILVKIDDVEYSMYEVDSVDTKYLDGKDYFFNIKNLDISTHTYQFYVADSEYTWTTALMKNLNVYNTPPEIITKNNLTAIEDIYYEMSYEYEDIDNENIGQLGVWNFSTNASWIEFKPPTAVLNGIPLNDDVGKYWINISVSDTIEIDYRNFTISVINVNDAPMIITDDTKTAVEDKLYEVNYNAIDVDTPIENLIWNLETNADWLNFLTAATTLFGTPANDNVGEYWVNVSISDIEYIDYTNFTLTVMNVNDPPDIITEAQINAMVGELYSVNYEVEDIDPPPNIALWALTTNASSWLTINETTGRLNGTPAKNDGGRYWVNVSVNDGEGGRDYHNFTITVAPLEDGISKEESSWYWLILIVIVLVIVILIITLYIYKKRKAASIPTVRAELLHAPPEHVALPSITSSTEGVKPLPSQPVISEQLPTPKVTIPSLAPAPAKPLPQLPQATLSKAQKLGLLEERFLRGEVDLETYKELKTKIEGERGEELSEEVKET